MTEGFRRIAACWVLVLACAGFAPVPASGEAGTGADGVGFRDIAVEIEGGRLTVALWYPSAAPSGRTVIGPFTMAATSGAPVGAGRYGLVLMSHGTGGGRLNHRGTAIRLARAGYIVAAPEHAGDNWRDNSYSGTSANWRRRPRQLSATLDRLLDDPEFGLPHRSQAVSGPSGTPPAATACSP